MNGNEDGTYYMISGNTVTFSLKNAGTSTDRISYISALEMVNGDKSKVIWTANENEYPASAGFELTNDFLWQYKEYWTLKPNLDESNGNHGLYGDIQIRPVVKNYPVTIRVKEDDRCEYIKLWDGKDKEKDYTKSGDTRVYTYSRGDYVRYDAKLKEKYQVGYYWDGITVTYQGLANPKTYHITEAIPYVLEREMQYQTDVTMHIPMRDNEVVVRVSQDDWQLFDHDKGIFKEEYVKKDGYYYYTVEKDAGKIPFNVFQLSASLKEESKSMVPVWKEAFHSEKYAQDLYFFEGKEKKEENVVDLSLLYVNGGKELDSYIINGSIFYDTGLVGEEARTEGWYPATGAWAVAGTAAFGIADQKGNFSILRVNAASGYYVKMRIGTGGIFVYRTVKLGSSMTIDSQRVVIRAYSAARPRFTQLNAYAYDAEGKRIEKPLQYITLNNQGSVLTTELLAQTTDYDLNGKPIEYTYNYSVEVGGKKIVKQATAVEKVTKVEFVVFDGKTRQEKSVYQTAKKEADGSWKVYNVFSVGKYTQYAAGDMLYARLITDRKIDDGQDVLEKINETVYPPVNTGLVFAEEQRTDPELVDFKIPEEGKYSLPVLGSLTTQMNVRKLNLGVEATGDRGIRVYVGAAIRPQGSHYDSDGKPINDAQFRYNQENVLDGIEDMVKELNGGENSVASAPNGIGIPAWSFAPIAGLYLEFAMVIVENSENAEEGSNDLHHRIIGGGIYVGFMGSLRYTYYMLLGPVPAYVGGDVSVMMMLEAGVARTGTENDSMSLAKLNQPFVNNLQNKVHFNFIYRAQLMANAYAGVGICGTLGVRGGFSLNVLFLTNPTIKKQYPHYRSTGFSISGSIKFWVDALLCSIPIPTFVNHTWNFGYFKDIALKSDSEDGEESQTAEKLEIISKYRPSAEADFTGNDTERSVIDTGDSVWEGVIKGRELISGAYDDASVRVIAVQTPSDAPKKVLMTYLEDNLDRNDNDRTRLMYSVYTDNEEDGFWNEPVPVDADGAATADFSPSLCDRGDDVLITWISRKTPLPKDSTNYAEQLKTLQVYTARYIKKTGVITDVTQVTDDDYMYANPKAIYDSKTGKTFLFYLKSEVSLDEITNGTDLINSVNPQTNEAEVAFRIFDRENKEITEYYSYELPEDPQLAKAVKDALQGERFIPSEIEDVVKNPVVYDYDVVMADLARGDAPLCRAICKMAGIDYEKVEAGDEAACTAYDSYCENHAKEIEELAKEVKTYGVYAFVVDADNSLTTTADREIYVQLLDPATHKYSAPRKITDNEYGESSLKIVSDSRTSYLFWLEDGEKTGISETEANEGTMQYSKAGRTVRYLDLSEVIDDSTKIPHTVSIGQLSADGMKDGSSLTDYSVFADTQDSLFLFWRENTNEIGTDKETAEELQQDIFVTALVRSKETGDAAWSDGVRLTNMVGVNNVPAVAEIDGRILVVSNNYVPDMTGTEIVIKKASLNETVFVPMGRMAASEVSVGKLPDQKGEKAELTVTFMNEGNEPVSVKGFTYSMQLFDGETPVSDKVSGTAPGALNPQSRQYITKTLELTQDIQQTSNTLKLVASATTDGATITKELELGNDLPKYRFENIQVVQEGEQFHLTGKVLNTAVVDGSTEDVLIVNDTDYKEITRRPLSELENGSMQFEEMIPITDAIAELGRVELVLSVERDGKECSVKAYPRGYMAYPIGLKLNGSDSDQLKLKVGQSIVLDGEFKQSLYFGESSMLYSIDDSSSVATLNGNVLTANKAGTTRLSMTTRLFGGSKDVTVIVEENPAPDPEDPSGGGSGSVSTTPGGPASAVQLSGSWKQNADGTWSFVKSDGKAAAGWGKTGYGSGTEYWHFNEKGIMDTGWYMDSDGSWYYLHEASDGRKGAMDRGWHFDTRDNRWYYLNPDNGKMKTGWVYVSGKWYYLSPEAAKPSWRKNAAGQWIYSGTGRAYGAMYANETTPDGYKVGADGAWIK